MTSPVRCRVCGDSLQPDRARWRILRWAQRVPRAALTSPDPDRLAYRTRSYAFYDEGSWVCQDCSDGIDDAAHVELSGLKRATLVLASIGFVLMVVACSYAVSHPDAGPDLWRLVWNDPANRPPPTGLYGPYKPPFQ